MRLEFHGQTLEILPAGVLFWPAEGMLVVSDLHLEKASHAARRGYFLPPYDSRETLSRLLAALDDVRPRQLLLLGDCFHDVGGYRRLPVAEREAFDSLRAYNPIWIVGNHDGEFVPDGFAAHDTFERCGLVFRHEAEVGATAEVSGHFHPKAELVHKGAKISRACFVQDSRKIMMPAFGALTGGLSVRDPAVRGHFADDIAVHVLSRTRIYSFSF